MDRGEDKLSKSILSIVNNSEEPLETKEIEEGLKGDTRTKIFYRLNNLRGNGVIKGKFVGGGKGAWIWWKINLFDKEKSLEVKKR